MSRFPSELLCCQPDEDLLCSICQDVLDEPLQTPCQHVFCHVCIMNVAQTDFFPACPLCREGFGSLDLKPAPHILRNILGKLEMRCNNDLCGEVFTIEGHSEHQNICDFVTVTCPFEDCNNQCLRLEMSHHMTECVYRSVLCPAGCGETVQFRGITYHLLTYCWVGLAYCDGCGGLYVHKEDVGHVCARELERKLEDVLHQTSKITAEMRELGLKLSGLNLTQPDTPSQERSEQSSESIAENEEVQSTGGEGPGSIGQELREVVASRRLRTQGENFDDFERSLQELELGARAEAPILATERNSHRSMNSRQTVAAEQSRVLPEMNQVNTAGHGRMLPEINQINTDEASRRSSAAPRVLPTSLSLSHRRARPISRSSSLREERPRFGRRTRAHREEPGGGDAITAEDRTYDRNTVRPTDRNVSNTQVSGATAPSLAELQQNPLFVKKLKFLGRRTQDDDY